MYAKKILGDNGVEYVVRATKPVEQVLDEKWYLWYSDSAELKEDLQTMVAMLGMKFTMIKAIDVVKAYITEALYQECSSVHNDLVQLCLDFTDWQKLTERLCITFDVPIYKGGKNGK